MSPMLVIFLVGWSILATVAALFFALDGSRKGVAAGLMEAENRDLRSRIAELTAELRQFREASGAPTDARTRATEDLMPLRMGTRSTKPTRKTSTESSGTVAVVSADHAERQRIADAIAPNGYQTILATLADAPRLARELNTTAIVLDLRDTETATEAPALLESFAADALAKEVPVFALIKSASERERLLEDSHYTAAFVTPTDTALLASTLGAAVIRRRTRARRAEAARSVAAFGR